MKAASDVAFSAAVKNEQRKRGSRAAYQRMEEGEGWETTVTEELRAFLAERDSVYFATASAEGQPYVQHRGGEPGFVKVLGETTLAFADFAGNRQYVSVGNLAENPRAFLFAMDYARRKRVKIWGKARVMEGDGELVGRVVGQGNAEARGKKGARVERVIVFEVEAWDVNCPQYIPQKIDARDVAAGIREMEGRIEALEGENAGLREKLARAGRG
ncbi:MAG TPA: pyridoxamine 5'-phosphate oxidase family protein [Polyangiaceae bacterium]